MSDNGAGTAKAESSFKQKEGSLFPKEKKSVLKMVSEAAGRGGATAGPAGKATSSYIDKTKNKSKTYPRDEADQQ
ncbi:hypothetical protein Acr_21g0004440 [Actinidia rufa]|uniref:Uncharacterized protein n=1 Tax=Actinidia rufa TaxID=165716 RepID=A0A7J0GGE7_9ERIC|nr:hypothetical protein Acr_21g0004440 [Actinidia rufa]